MDKSFKEKIRPDKFNLDTEWVEQPDLFNEYSILKDLAKEKEDKAKEMLSVIDAEIDLDIRKNFKTKYGLDKAPEAAIKATILVHPKHRGAQDAYLQARHEHEILKTAVGAISQKHDALQELTKIWIKGYYSESVPTEGATMERVSEMKQEVVKERKRVRRTNK